MSLDVQSREEALRRFERLTWTGSGKESLAPGTLDASGKAEF